MNTPYVTPHETPEQITARANVAEQTKASYKYRLERIATACMASLLGDPTTTGTPEALCECLPEISVKMAQALIKEIDNVA